MNAPAAILIADDEPLFGTTTAEFLAQHGYAVTYVEEGERALELVSQGGVDVVIADLDMPGNRRLELLNACRQRYPDVPFLVVTGRPTLPSAIEGIRLGVHDYFLKPLDLDDLLHSVRRALPAAGRATTTSGFAHILGESPALQHVKQLADRVARSNATVLICGESGSGKELLARGIHAQSQRASAPFVTVDCASIPDSLLESTLFGHVRGAFTGAVADRSGLAAAAEGGTLFLDEIGELPLPMQAKLLRLLQFGAFVPVGSTKPQHVDVRIVAATNRNLGQEVERGAFRLDLFYRLSVLEIFAPPLRDRRDDIPLLARHFLTDIVARDRLSQRTLADDAVQTLQEHAWPGNVRELQNTMERCACLAAGTVITADDVRRALQGSGSGHDLPVTAADVLPAADLSPTTPLRQDYLSTKERRYLVELLQRHRGNVSRAAREAGMSRQGLHKALGRLAIDPKEFRHAAP